MRCIAQLESKSVDVHLMRMYMIHLALTQLLASSAASVLGVRGLDCLSIIRRLPVAWQIRLINLTAGSEVWSLESRHVKSMSKFVLDGRANQQRSSQRATGLQDRLDLLGYRSDLFEVQTGGISK
jgi:hypothetical protein